MVLSISCILLLVDSINQTNTCFYAYKKIAFVKASSAKGEHYDFNVHLSIMYECVKLSIFTGVLRDYSPATYTDYNGKKYRPLYKTSASAGMTTSHKH